MLILDVGNSRIKWAFVEQRKWTRQGAIGNSEWLALQQEFALLPQPKRILVSNVAGEAMAQYLARLCGRWQVSLEFITAQAEQCGVRNGYKIPEKLGSDRWAALIAAWHRVHGACLVVNCGTATTVDALSATGEFIGGLILPGINLMRQSLVGGAALLGEQGGQLQDLPLNTVDALYSGVLRATMSAILHQYKLVGAQDAPCILSGGAADELYKHLALPLQRADNLVLHGVQIIGASR
jgi:type III pantothenate kinase